MNASIRWPSGLVQQLHDLPINHRIWVEEGAQPSRIEPFGKASQASNVFRDGLDNWSSKPGCSCQSPHRISLQLASPRLFIRSR